MTRSTKLVTLAAILAVALRLVAQTLPPVPVWPEEPTGFKSVQFGWTETQAKDSIASASYNNSAFCNDSENGERSCMSWIGIGEIHVRIFYNFDSTGFCEVSGTFPSEAYQIIRAVFVAKYGQPHAAVESDVQTNGGGTFKQEDLHWTGPHADVALSHYGLKVSEGFFKITTAAKLAKEKKKAEDELRKALQ